MKLMEFNVSVSDQFSTKAVLNGDTVNQWFLKWGTGPLVVLRDSAVGPQETSTFPDQDQIRFKLDLNKE